MSSFSKLPIVFISLFSFAAFADSGTIEADKWLGRDRIKTFDSIISQLQQFPPVSGTIAVTGER